MMEGSQCNLIQLSTAYVKMIKDYLFYAAKVFGHRTPTFPFHKIGVFPMKDGLKSIVMLILVRDFSKG